MSDQPLPESGQATKPPSGSMARALRRLIMRLAYRDDTSSDPERARHAALISSFGVLGSIFGLIYATFYLFIGHKWGALIVMACSMGFAVTPFWMRHKKVVEPAGHFLILM